MAHYTITILTLQKNNFDFGLQNYPIFDENYRNTLNNNILNYYLESEIGFETANLFKRILNDRMQLIMPKYNKMYSAQLKLLETNIFNNVDLEETYSRNKTNGLNTTGSSTQSDTGTGTQTGSSTSNNKNLYQDTPQGSVSMETLDSANVYATNFTLDNNSTSSSVSNNSTSSSTLNNSTSSNETGTEQYVKHLIGNNGKKYKFELYDEYNKILENLINIDMIIINELQDLFMGIF